MPGPTANRYDRHMFGDGLAVWLYEVSNSKPIEHRGHAAGLEAGVQVRGSWYQHGSHGHTGWFEPGAIHRLNASEKFDVRFQRPGPPGLQVGFALYPAEVSELSGVDGELAFSDDGGKHDDILHEWASWLIQDRPGVGVAVKREGRSVILNYVRRHAVIVAADPLTRVKREIEAHYSSELYVAHLAELAGLHPEVLARQFRRRYGITPVAYRKQCRLAAASTMTWARPDLSVRDIAEAIGFHDVPYFHREFRAQFGMTPAEWGRRALAPTQPRSQPSSGGQHDGDGARL